MRKLVTGVTAVLAMVNVAFAADPLDPEKFDQRWSWDGAYAGATAGYGWVNDEITNPAFCIFGTDCFASASSDVYGVFVGYNMQMDNIVIGAELEYTHHGSLFDDTSGVSILDMGSFNLRAGYAAGRFLGYGFVGATYGRTESPAIALAGLPDDWVGDDFGIAYGVGVDVKVTEDIFAGLQYQRQSYRNFSENPIDADIDTVKLRLGYGF